MPVYHVALFGRSFPPSDSSINIQIGNRIFLWFIMVFDEMHYLDLHLSFKQYSFQGIKWNILNILVYISGNIFKYKYVERYSIDIT